MFQSLKPAGDAYNQGMVTLFTNDTSESMVYKSNLDFKGQTFSSLIYLKKTSGNAFNMVLMTAFGNTMLEGTFTNDKFEFKNVVSYLDHKQLLSLLENDWRLLLRGNLMKDVPEIYSIQDQLTVYDFKDGKTNNLYYYSAGKKSVEMIESYSGSNKKIIMNIERMYPKSPESIAIEHPGMNLKINMIRVKNSTDNGVE
jgi:hypothetical protein